MELNETVTVICILKENERSAKSQVHSFQVIFPKKISVNLLSGKELELSWFFCDICQHYHYFPKQTHWENKAEGEAEKTVG